MPGKRKGHAPFWAAAIAAGAPKDAPFGHTKSGKVRMYPLKGTPRGRSGPRNSSTVGRVRDVPADQTNWRTKLQQSRIKFDDVQKEVFLTQYALHGLKMRAAAEATVNLSTVNGHIENDPDFAEAVLQAVATYRDKCVDHATDLLFDGEIHKSYDKDGNLLNEKHVYPIRLIELELKRVEPAYRDKQTIDVNTRGTGVLVAPAEVTPEDWVRREDSLNADKTVPDGAEKEDDNV